MPLGPHQVGFGGVVNQVPPPAFLQDLFNQNPIVTFLDVGIEPGCWVADV